MGDRALVTGGSGFIGSHLVEALLQRGDEVHCLLLPGDRAANLSHVRTHVAVHQADLVDLDGVQAAVEAARPDVVYHLAAVGVTDVHVDPAFAVRVNVEGMLNLLSILDGAYRVFVNTGTCHEYGQNEPPFREDQDPRPELPYAITKTVAWRFCARLHATRGWPIVTLRPFSVYGPRQGANALIPTCIRAAQSGRDFDMTMGEQRRDFVYVQDVVAGFIRAASVPQAVGRTFNLCSGRETTIYEMVRLVVAEVGSGVTIHRGALPYRSGEIWRLIGDNAQARTLLGWEPQMTLEEGIRRTVAAARRVSPGSSTCGG
jgi:nucleoside-diphosphate-sugar epimerase